jgi:Sugar (and other) transporter
LIWKPAFFTIGLPFAVESPWYLIHRGDVCGARRALQRLYGKNANIDDKLKVLQSTVAEHDAHQRARWVDCFRGTNLVRTGISTGVFVCQHATGIIFVLGYSTYFFELAGLSTVHAYDLGVGITALGVIGTIVSWMLVNNCGRRILFLTGMATLTLCLLLIGLLDVIPISAAAWGQASLIVIYALIYQSSIGATAFVLLGEVSSPPLRAKTTALATATQSVLGIALNLAVSYMVNPDAANMKGKVGFVFGGLALLATFVSFFYVPELKGRTFEEIDIMFGRRVSPRRMGTYSINQ